MVFGTDFKPVGFGARVMRNVINTRKGWSNDQPFNLMQDFARHPTRAIPFRTRSLDKVPRRLRSGMVIVRVQSYQLQTRC